METEGSTRVHNRLSLVPVLNGMDLVHELPSYLKLLLLLLLLLLLYNLMYSITVLRSFTVAFSDDILFFVRCLYHRVSIGGPDSRVIWTTPSPIQSG